jgi:glycogen operon protein
VTAHDGFTLEDLVSYNHKHNMVNGEENRDGANLNFSTNHGIEGPSKDPRVVAARARHKRNLLTTLFLAQGVPMLLGGDEMGRTQRGNNNAYCLDNEVTWLKWKLDGKASDHLRFVQRLASIRGEHRALRRTSFFAGQPLGLLRRRDLVWYQHDGSEMTHTAWNAHELSSVALLFSNGSPANPATEEEEWLVLVLNQSKLSTGFVMPDYPRDRPGSWCLELLTTEPETPDGVRLLAGETFNLEPESTALWSWQAR